MRSYADECVRAALAAQAAEHASVVDKCNSYILDNARLAEANDALRAEVEDAYTEMRKQWPFLRVVFDAEVWRRAAKDKP